MALSGSQIEELREALLGAFDEPSLKQMVRVGLEENLPVVAGGVTLREIVYNLITWAERTGRIDDLVAAAVAANPGNPALKAFAAKYQGDGDEPPVPPPPDKPQSPSGPPGGASIGVYVAGNISTGGGDVVGGDKTVHGDEVRGDKVMGDQTKVGDIGAHAAVAIGPGATIVQQVVSEADLRDRENLRVLRQMVTKYWIEGVLEKSLNHEAAIRLGLTDRSGMVENRPWRVIPHLDEDGSRDLPPGTHIVDVYDQMNQRLLILGEPGSGKTTLLLELARGLIKRADANPLLPSPVVFNLSSWSQRKLPLADWMVEELRIRYIIPKKIAQVWVTQDKLLPLLDGLDEVQPEHRGECADTINQYVKEHLVPLAVCSRIAEYESLSVRLKLHGAVLLQLLTAEQVDDYLNRGGPTLSALRTELQQDVQLDELAKSPLMLSVMALAYQGASPAELALSDAELSRRRHLFDAYIQRMFIRREVEPIYSPHQTIRWLRWLSTRLVEYGQTVFLFERMQPGWLHSGDQTSQTVHSLLLAGPLYGLGGGLICGLIFGLLGGYSLGLTYGLSIGLICGVSFALVDMRKDRYKTITPLERSRAIKNRLKSSLYATLYFGLFGGVMFVLCFILLLGVILGGLVGFGVTDGALFGTLFALIYGVIGGLVAGFFMIEPVGSRRRSWQQIKSNLKFGLGYGLSVGLSFGLTFVLISGLNFLFTSGQSIEIFAKMAVLILISGATSGAISGMLFATIFQPSTWKGDSVTLETRHTNQGIRSSAQYAAITGLSYGLVFGVVFGLLIGLLYDLGNGLIGGLVSGLVLALIGGLVGGGDVVTKHFILRIGLWRQGHIPLMYARFLDYATGLIFLRKMGGGYIFVHRLIMEHFASLTEQDIERIIASLNVGGDESGVRG